MKHRSRRRTRSPTTPTSTRSSAPTGPDTVTLIANYIPFEDPAGGPNFYEFGDDVSYRIKVNNSGNARSDITYEFRFETTIKNPNTFLYNTGQITSLDDENFNRPQTMKVYRWKGEDGPELLGEDLILPPCNVGPRSTPNYPALANSAIYDLPGGIKVFAGQRLEGFYVDVGSVFDLGVLRPFQNLHLIPTPAKPGVPHAARVQRAHDRDPGADLAADPRRLDPDRPARREGRPRRLGDREPSAGQLPRRGRARVQVGPFQQVSRLAMPLFNEVITPMALKDKWNRNKPINDAQYAQVRRAARAGQAPAGPLPRRVPEPGRAQRRPRR